MSTADRWAVCRRLIVEVIAPPRTKAPAPAIPRMERTASNTSSELVAAVAAKASTVTTSDPTKAVRWPSWAAAQAVPRAPTR